MFSPRNSFGAGHRIEQHQAGADQGAEGPHILQKFGVKELEPEVIVDGTVMDEGRVVSAIKELLAEHNVKLKQVAVSIPVMR